MCCDVCGSVGGSANVSGWVWYVGGAVHRYLRKLESSDPPGIGVLGSREPPEC